MPFLIDGHNVIAAMESIDLDDPNDEAKLVLRLRTWSARKRKKATVVFDGGVPGGLSRRLSTADIAVIFAARHHTIADRIIDERLRSLRDAPNWTVVSSDHEVLDQARATGARTMTAQAFADVLEHPTGSQQEKPKTISAAEVEAWLDIFPEPEAGMNPARPAPGLKQGNKAQTKHRAEQPSPQPRTTPPAAQTRGSRPIGAQVGLAARSQDEPLDSDSEKPNGMTEEELEGWLQVFHDDPNSKIPPPDLPKDSRPSQRRKAKAAVVRKTGGLSSEEVDAWLNVFSESPDAPEGVDQQPSEAEPPRPRHRRKLGSTLAKHKQNVPESSEQAAAELPDEDVELWRRLFGED